MKKQGIAILLVLLFMLWDGISFAEEDRITPFYYSFATPTADDLSKEEAESIADAYFIEHSDRIFVYHEDIAQYQKVTNFIRKVQNDQVTYCWVIAYNNGESLYSFYGFIGMVIVSSPDGRILDSATDYPCLYWICFSDWDDVLVSKTRSTAEVYGMLDLIALPANNRVKHLLPNMNTIREEEALQIANQLVAGYQHIKEEEVSNNHNIIITLEQNLLISDYPFWKVRYTKFYSDDENDSPFNHYTITIYAHTGTVWYTIDCPAKKVLYVDYTYCNLPLSQESFEPDEWQLTDAHLLFATP